MRQVLLVLAAASPLHVAKAKKERLNSVSYCKRTHQLLRGTLATLLKANTWGRPR